MAAASASNTTTLQYPMWIVDDKIYCDEAELKHHLIQKLNYNEDNACRVIQQITELLNNNNGLRGFWRKAAEKMSTEVIRVILQSIEHTQLIYMLSYRDVLGDTAALYWCADNKRSDVIEMILDCCVSEEQCYQLLISITDSLGWTPLHASCIIGDTESVRVMLNHINQDMRYSLLQMRDRLSNTPLHHASLNGHTDVMKMIHESVTQTQWINLLQMKGFAEMTVLQTAAYWDEQSSCIETIRESVSDEEWMKLVSTHLPEDHRRYDETKYQRAVSKIDELRTAARVKSALLIANQSG